MITGILLFLGASLVFFAGYILGAVFTDRKHEMDCQECPLVPEIN